MSIAVVQGCSKGLGLALTRALLTKTKLHVVGTTASGADQARKAILSVSSGKSSSAKEPHSEGGYGGQTSGGYGGADASGGHKDGTIRKNSNGRNNEHWESRLTTLDLDVRDESAIKHVAETVKDKHGQGLRLLVNVSGMLHAEKSLKDVNVEQLLDTFKVNTFGHLMMYKHFASLLPHRSQLKEGEADPAQGVIPPERSALVSLSARVGSISDNERGGWYSYRSSKAALNQVIRTLSHELIRKSPQHPALCVAYHPGTMLTDLSKPYTSGQTPENTKGLFSAEEAAENLLRLISGLKDDMSGGFWAYDGTRIPW